MRASARLGIVAVALIAAACGDDGGSVGTEGIDAGAGGIDAAVSANEPDAGASGHDGGSGASGPGQFCDVLADGGPTCEEGLECCEDNVCRAPDDCASGGYVPCECSDDCQGSICCDAPSMRFCTKRSACKSYEGTEDTTCP